MPRFFPTLAYPRVFSLFLTVAWLTCLLPAQARSNDELPVAEESGIHLNDEQIKALGLRFVPLQPAARIGSYAWPGMVDIPLAHRDILSTPVAGRIKKVLVVHGEVKKGQPLVILDSSEAVALQKDYLDTLAQLHEAEKTYARIQRLRKAGSASEKQFLAAKTRRQILHNRLQVVTEKLLFIGLEQSQLKKLTETGQPFTTLTLKAPKDGLLFDLQTERNQLVSAGQTLAHIGEIGEVVVDVDLPIDALKNLKTGSAAQIVGEPIQGTIAFIGQQADPTTQRVTVHVRFDNTRRLLLPGAFVRVQFIEELPAQGKSYRLPSRALVAGESGETLVFLRQETALVPEPVEVLYRDDREAVVAFGKPVDKDAHAVAFGAIFLKSMLGEEGEEE